MAKKIMYLGPMRPFDLPLQTRAVLCGEPEEVFPEISKRLEELPELRKLFVPIADIPKAKAALNTEGSPLYAAYKKVQETVAEWRKAQRSN